MKQKRHSVLMLTVVWNVTLRSLEEVYRRFRRSYCLHNGGRWRQQHPPKRLYASIRSNGSTCKKTEILIIFLWFVTMEKYLMTFFNKQARKWPKCQMSGGFNRIYLYSYTYTYWTRGVWLYPLYYHLNWTQQLLINVFLGFFLPSAYYLLGEKLAGVIWGELVFEEISHTNI